MEIDLDRFIAISTEDVDDHIFELYTDRTPESNQNLGYIDRSSNEITIELADGRELTILQSMSELGSTKETSSTGFICWKSSALFVNWMLTKGCPFNLNDKTVLEFGAGVGGIVASTLAPLSSNYIASDQKHILKLLRHNIMENIQANVTSSTIDLPKSNTKTNRKTPISKKLSLIDIIEFDWEHLTFSENSYHQVMEDKPDLIVACDTIYNEYLIPFFVDAIKSMLSPTGGALVIAQLRNSELIQVFAEQVLGQNLNLYYIPNEMLSLELCHGFVVYYITSNNPEL